MWLFVHLMCFDDIDSLTFQNNSYKISYFKMKTEYFIAVPDLWA